MKLYYSPGACSLAPHIVLEELGLPYEAVLASTKTKKLPDGSDYHVVNSKGQVPVLELDGGERLTEGPVIVQYLADQAPARKLAPAQGTMARYRVQEWLNYTTSELHKNIGTLFNPAMPEDGKAVLRARATSRLQWINDQLAGRKYLMGDEFSIADPYLYTVSRWAAPTGIDLSGMTHLNAFMARMNERPGVQAALKAEGLNA